MDQERAAGHAGHHLRPGSGSRSVERLENVGFEAHTYLHHLIAHYDRLAPITVFCHGPPFDHAHDLHEVLRRLAAGTETVEDFRWLGFLIDNDDPQGRRQFVPWYENEDVRPVELDRFCHALFGAPTLPWTHFWAGSEVGVHRSLLWWFLRLSRIRASRQGFVRGDLRGPSGSA